LSSVLRALRKLEQETYAASGKPGGRGSKTGSGRYSVNPVWRHRLRTATVVLLFSLAGFGAVSAGRTWLFPFAATETGTAGQASGEQDNDDGRKPDSSRPVSTPDAFNVPPVFSEDDTTWLVINKDTVLPPETLSEGSDVVTSDPVSSDATDSAISGDAADPLFSSSSSSSAAVSAPAAPEFPELDPSAGVSLQAISWSPDPGRRLAVINGRLCREGESIEGFVLVRISPDDVLLSDGRVSARLVFKIL
jgi:hypothetical protein